MDDLSSWESKKKQSCLERTWLKNEFAILSGRGQHQQHKHIVSAPNRKCSIENDDAFACFMLKYSKKARRDATMLQEVGWMCGVAFLL